MRLLVTVCSLALVSVVSSNLIPLTAVHTSPGYAYNYAVNDPISKDNKAQWETRIGDSVKGSYSLVEPDGSLRVVDYSANDHTGFNAVVKKIGPTVHSPPLIHAPLVAPLAAPLAAPLVPPLSPLLHTSIVNPILPTYGLGPAALAIGLPKTATLGKWSLPWDPLTRSYGGWVPIGPSPYTLGHGRGPYATLIKKTYDKKGRLLSVVVSPSIPFGGKTLIVKKRHG